MILELSEDDAKRLTGLLTVIVIDGNPSLSSVAFTKWARGLHDRLQEVRIAARKSK
jgi:hypothetical protein